MRHRSVIAGLLAACGLWAAGDAAAQPIGAFSWQLQPFCNVVTVNVTQDGGVYTLDGYDNQCGAAQRAPLVGLATPNPDGSIGLGPEYRDRAGRAGRTRGRADHAPTLGGSWSDSAGNSGGFTFSGQGGVIPSTGPDMPSFTIAPGSIGPAQLAAGRLAAVPLPMVRSPPQMWTAPRCSFGSTARAPLAST